jgi:ArsR family transcriptional regulator, virulence genes transcriptional regulator
MEARMADYDQQLSSFAMESAKAAAAMRSLGNEARLLVLCHLSEAFELSAGELTRRVGLSQSALSQHLARLREDGLVTTRKEAQSVFYRVADLKVRRVLTLLHELYCPDIGRSGRRRPVT